MLLRILRCELRAGGDLDPSIYPLNYMPHSCLASIAVVLGKLGRCSSSLWCQSSRLVGRFWWDFHSANRCCAASNHQLFFTSARFLALNLTSRHSCVSKTWSGNGCGCGEASNAGNILIHLVERLTAAMLVCHYARSHLSTRRYAWWEV